jgi:hypothetical protein
MTFLTARTSVILSGIVGADPYSSKAAIAVAVGPPIQLRACLAEKLFFLADKKDLLCSKDWGTYFFEICEFLSERLVQ